MIADARALGATEYWLLGDVTLPGPGREVALVDAVRSQQLFGEVRDDCLLETLNLEQDHRRSTPSYSQYLMEGLDPKQLIRSLPLK